MTAVLVCSVTLASAAPKSAQRPGEKPCREAANGLVSLLDAKADGSATYRDTYAVVVNTCGPASAAPKSAPKPQPPGRAACPDLAAAMVDLIEDGKMNAKAFVTARDDFALTCPPR